MRHPFGKSSQNTKSKHAPLDYKGCGTPSESRVKTRSQNTHPWTTKDAAPLRKVESKHEVKTRTLGLQRMRHPFGKLKVKTRSQNTHPWTTKDAAPLRKVESKHEVKTRTLGLQRMRHPFGKSSQNTKSKHAPLDFEGCGTPSERVSEQSAPGWLVVALRDCGDLERVAIG